MNKTYTRKENLFFRIECWLWIGIFSLSSFSPFLRFFQAEPWTSVFIYAIGTLLVGVFITKVLKMRMLNRPKRAFLYGCLTIVTIVFFFTPWQVFFL